MAATEQSQAATEQAPCSHLDWCDEMVELATGPTPAINERHICWHRDGIGHHGQHKCSCGFTWAAEEVSC